MAIPSNKKELHSAIEVNYQKLYSELQLISEDQAAIKDLDGHAKNTKMSIHNLVSYLIGWGELVLKWNLKKEKSEQVHFPETGYKWNELGLLAQKFYKDYSEESYASLLKKFEQTVKEIQSLMGTKTNSQLYKTVWYEKYTLGRMIQLNTASPYSNARLRIRKWKKSMK